MILALNSSYDKNSSAEGHSGSQAVRVAILFIPFLCEHVLCSMQCVSTWDKSVTDPTLAGIVREEKSFSLSTLVGSTLYPSWLRPFYDTKHRLTREKQSKKKEIKFINMFVVLFFCSVTKSCSIFAAP